MVVDVTQIADSFLQVGMDKLMGTNFAPQWMKDDVNGTINNVVAGVNYLGKLATDGQTRQEAWNHMGQAVDSMVKSFMDDPAYALGGAAFEVASMFIGVGEVKAGITAARAGQGFLRGVAAFGKTVGKAAIRNADDLARGIGRLATRGVGLTKDLGQRLATKFTSFIDDIARASAGLVDDVSNMARQTRNGWAYAMGGEVSDDFLKSGARVYNVGGEAAEGAGRRATAKFSQETSEAVVEHVDDIPRLDEVTVEFKYKEKFDEEEFSRQLTGQQDGLNDLTVQEYFDNRERYLTEGRSKEGAKAQRRARQKALADKINEYMDEGMSRSEAKTQAKEWIKDKAALHEPDQIAGGDPTKIRGVGDSRVNNSLGAQWKSRADAMDEQIRRMAEGMSPEELQNTYLNINLTY